MANYVAITSEKKRGMALISGIMSEESEKEKEEEKIRRVEVKIPSLFFKDVEPNEDGYIVMPENGNYQ